jgi:GT2 family glycosyltransferase
VTHRAAIVIPVWNSWELTRACLTTLRPTLRDGDEVVVVDNGSEDSTAAGLTDYPWITVITNASNRGFAAACNQGAAAARADIVVFLNNDTLLSGGWLDALCAPFTDDTVGATGPRSNCVSGPQLVDPVGYDPAAPAGLAAWASDWASVNRGRVDETRRLVGFCLAVRREAFEAIGGFDEGFGIGGFEDDDLCSRLVDQGWRLLIAHASFVHHIGHQTFDANGLDWMVVQLANQPRFVQKRLAGAPLLSACVTARNATDVLPGCLDSLAGLVDEVVVYDAGSTDATVAMALAAGATVVEGPGRGRDEALAAARSYWVLALDADERIDCDPAAFRLLLSVGALPDIIGVVPPGDARPGGNGAAAVRLGRRHLVGWASSETSELAAASDRRPGPAGVMPGARLTRVASLTTVLGSLSVPGTLVEQVADFIAPDQLGRVRVGIGGLAPDVADRLLERLWGRYPGDPDLAAAVGGAGPTFDVDRALDWSVRLRAHGWAGHCPLLAMVAAPDLDPVVRLRAATLVTAAFGEAIDDDDARSIGRALPPSTLAAALADVAETAPELVPLVATGAVLEADLAAALADALDRTGASDAAGELRAMVTALA